MDINSKSWKEKWSENKYPPSNPSYFCTKEYGTDFEPDSSIWCASLLEPVIEQLQEPFSVLDYGCGNGRLFNFLSRHFKNFTYYGLDTKTNHGIESIKKAKDFFQHDNRACFGHEIVPCDLNVFGSVATHISIELFESILKNLTSSRIGTVASFLISDKYYFDHSGLYEDPNCYGHIYYTKEMIESLAFKLNLQFNLKELFVTKYNDFHYIYNFFSS